MGRWKGESKEGREKKRENSFIQEMFCSFSKLQKVSFSVDILLSSLAQIPNQKRQSLQLLTCVVTTLHIQ